MATDVAKRPSFADIADEIVHLRPQAAEVQKRKQYHAIEVQESMEVTAGAQKRKGSIMAALTLIQEVEIDTAVQGTEVTDRASRTKSSTITPLSPIQEMEMIPAIRVA